MSISKELFLAILSMDAYNRGYDAGIADGGQGDADGLGMEGFVGKAKIKTLEESGISQSDYAAWQISDFYAVSYTLTEAVGEEGNTLAAGTTIISYRGTDNTEFLSWSSEEGSDIWNSYAQGGGAPVTEASALASRFWRAVSEGAEQEVLLTGHSMGGGLAGVRP